MWSNFDTHDRKIGSCGEKLLHTILLLHRQCLRVYDNYHVCCGVAYAWSKDGTRGHYQSRYQRGLVTHTHSNNSIELPGKAHSVLPLQWMEPLCAPCVLYALLFRNISEGVCCLVYISTFSLLTPVNKPKDKLQQQQKAIRGNKIAVAESSSSSSIAGAEGASQSRNQNHQQDGLWIFS